MNNTPNQNSFLRTSRNFPPDINLLALEVNRTYLDIANAVNNRTVSSFPSSRPEVTGENYYIVRNQRQQSFRQVYPFGAIAAGTQLLIPTGITNLDQFSRIYGTVVTTNNDYRPLPYIDPGTLTNGMALLVGIGAVNIRIILGATAAPVVNGIVVLEWLSEI